jgi:hypothetical protein
MNFKFQDKFFKIVIKRPNRQVTYVITEINYLDSYSVMLHS